MKRTIRNVFALLAVSLCAGSVFAQLSPQRVIASIPFEFYVGNAKLPAGQYEVYPEGYSDQTLVIRNLQSGEALIASVTMRTDTGEVAKSELVFDRDNDKSYLSIVRPFESNGYQLEGAHGKHSHVAVKSS